MPRKKLGDKKQQSFSDEDADGATQDNDTRKSSVSLSRRSHLVKELVDTQMHFVTDMTHLYNAMKAEADQLTDEDGRALFVSLHDVVQVSTKVHKIWKQELLQYPSHKCDRAKVAVLVEPLKSEISETFHGYSSRYDVSLFQKTDSLEPIMESVVKRLKEHKPLLVDLDTELIKPIQRMFKYSQLFEQLKDHTAENHPDYPATCEMFECFRQLLRKANEDKRWNEIINEVFNDPKPRNRRKSLKRLIFGEKLPSDPKLAQEKSRLNSLRHSAELIRKWLRDEFRHLVDTFKREQKFLESALHFCQPDGNICLHERVGWKPSQYPVCCDSITSQMSVTDTASTNMSFVTMPKIAKNVLERLEELNTLLHDPDLLIEQLEKTEKDLANAQVLLRQSEIKCQPTASIRELCTELEHTKQTLRDNLLAELPILLKSAEKFLLQVTSYACLIISDVTKGYANRMKYRLDQAKRLSQGNAQMNISEFTEYLDELLHKIAPDRQKKSIFACSPGSKPSIKRSWTNLSKPLITVLEHATDRIRFPETGSLKMRTHHSFSNGSSPILGHNQKPLSPNSPTPSLRSPQETQTNLWLPVPECNLSHSASQSPVSSLRATHRVLYDFKARNSNEVSICAGQSVTVLVAHDEAGNNQWFRITSLPEYKTGYVPANYLQKL